MFDVATLALGILGFGTGLASLTWNVVAFLWQGPRPKLTPIVGFRSGRGLVSINATRDARASLASAAKQVPPTGPLLVGLKVVNAGRAPFHVAEWAVRSDPSKTSLNPFDDWLDSPTVPRDIPPGASETFFTELNAAYALAAASKTLDGKQQRIVLTVSSGGRTFKTKPVIPMNLALGRP